MARRGFSAEQIVSKLRQIEVLMAQGKPAALADVIDSTNPRMNLREHVRA